ncbi:MAG: MoaD/ThiS family protein [Methylacidiphilales bacterium]|nr:MoaD/ThiS family protein [Candidatus Methylacidiphilales bacterium]
MTRVFLFHTLKDSAGTDRIDLAFDKPLDAAGLWELLIAHAPALASHRKSARIACNQGYLAPGERIHPGDEVALIPPVSGG